MPVIVLGLRSPRLVTAAALAASTSTRVAVSIAATMRGTSWEEAMLSLSTLWARETSARRPAVRG